MKHSSTSPLKQVWQRPPGNFQPQQYQGAGWSPTKNQDVQDQFQEFVKIFHKQNIEVVILPTAKDPDGIYVYDTFMHTKWGLILFQSPKPNRVHETKELASFFSKHIILGKITTPGSIDGGDVFWLDSQTLAVGMSWRSNREGFMQLKTLLSPYNINVEAFDLPNLFGPQECLHLMSVISPIREDLALIYPSALPIRLYQELIRRDIHCICVPEEEFHTLGSNVLALGDNKAISVGGNPCTAKALRAHGIELFELYAPDLCIAGTGGPTCLTSTALRL